ncbi:MAG: YidC/Oxa1 family insertase periplasmic-domain containing protein [Planctomycetota bacterium]|nr:YidC/Oxa1 family insertase periplasmic-domain containing protein [Planctomycetota bacterium]
MDSRRFLILLAVFAAGVTYMVISAKKDHSRPEPGAAPVASTQPGATQPATQPAGTPPVLAEAPAPQTQAASSQPVWGATGRNEKNPADLESVVIGNVDPAKGFPIELRLNTRDAGIQAAQLSQYYATVADKKLAARHAGNHQAYLEAVKKDRSYGGHYVAIQTAALGRDLIESYGTRVTKVSLADGSNVANAEGFDWRPAGAPTATSDTQTAQWRMAVLRDGKTVLEAVKTYTVRKNDYTVVMTLELANPSSQAVTVSLDQFGPVGVQQEDTRSDDRRVMHGRLDETRVQPLADVPKELEGLKPGEKHYIGTSAEAKPLLWLGAVNKFFGSMVYLVPKVAEAEKASRQAADYAAKFYLAKLDDAKAPHLLPGMEFPGVTIAPRQTETITFEIFTGPKSVEAFTNASDPYFRQRYKDLSYVGTVDLGACFLSWCQWDWLTMWLMWLLRKLSAVGNYGVAIILLVIIVRVLLHPLSRKSQVSMMKMQKLQPLMAQLKEKYKDDKDTLQKETMKLYKEQGAMPFLGCLPMFLQMPILIALWGSINASVELRHAAFLPVWITDLAAPDALFGLGFTIPLVGISTFNLLPLLLGAAMYWQMKVNPQAMGGASAATPDQQKQQKMMQVMMVGLMPVMFYNFPSGLSLYFMVSTFFGAAEQAVIRKHIRAREAEQAAVQTTVAAPGKGSRTVRPKKPKGPAWFKHS